MPSVEATPTNGILLLPERLQGKAAQLGKVIVYASKELGLSYLEGTLCILAIGNDMIYFNGHTTAEVEEEVEE